MFVQESDELVNGSKWINNGSNSEANIGDKIRLLLQTKQTYLAPPGDKSIGNKR